MKTTYKTGDQASLGAYECSRCNTAIAIDLKKEIIPICPSCNHDEFTKVEKDDIISKQSKEEIPNTLK